MRDKKTSRSKHLDFILLDLIVVELSYLFAFYIRHGYILGMKQEGVSADYQMMNVVVLLAHVAIVFYTENYSGIIRRGYLKEIQYVVTYNCELLAILLFVMFFSKQSADYSRITFATFFVLNNICMYLVRIIRKTYLRRDKKRVHGVSKMLVVTDEAHASRVIDGLKSYNYSGFVVKGVVITDKRRAGENFGDVPIVANKDGMFEYVRSHVVDEVFLEYNEPDLEDVINRFLAMGVVVKININRFIPEVPNVSLDTVNDYTVVSTSISQMSLKQRVLKRGMDVIVSCFGMIATIVLFIIFGPIIRTQSKGSVIYKQIRVGKNGRKFKIYKFRSMYAGTDKQKEELATSNEMSGPMFKMEDDPRITPIGRFIRKTSIDEFPQFWNILRGDMSLVGTRPPTVDEYKMYEQHHKSRLAMKPGLTGLWQVSGRNKVTDFEEVVRLDNEYIRNFSVNYDIKILAKTVKVVLARKGAK